MSVYRVIGNPIWRALASGTWIKGVKSKDVWSTKKKKRTYIKYLASPRKRNIFISPREPRSEYFNTVTFIKHFLPPSTEGRKYQFPGQPWFPCFLVVVVEWTLVERIKNFISYFARKEKKEKKNDNSRIVDQQSWTENKISLWIVPSP